MKKVRSQILLTPELEREVKNIAEKRGISISEAIRILLTQSLGGEQNREEKNIKQEDNPQKLYSLDDFTDQNPRIRGFKELFTVGATVPAMVVISDATFRYYLEHHSLPENLRLDLLKKALEFQEQSLTKKLVIRRAYVVPGLENPPGPRFLGLTIDTVIDSLIQLYDFAIEHNYHVKKHSQIVAFMHPFVDPLPLQVPVSSDAILPYGGSAVPVNTEGSRVEVFAVWGNNEGVQSFSAIDRYMVDATRGIILEKDIPQKNLMLATTTTSQSQQLEVPLSSQFKQILNDFEIIETARIARDLTKKYTPRRIEFSADGKDKLVYNESAPYEIMDIAYKNLSISGKIITIATADDIQKLGLKHDKKDTILYIDPQVVQQRAYDILNLVAGLKTKYVVLYPGLSATAHAMRVLADFGHTAIVVGNRRFVENEEIVVNITDGEVAIEKLSKRDHADFAVNLYDAKLYGAELVGGKSLNLSILKGKGFNVPHGIALTTEYFDYELKRQKKVKNISELYEGSWQIDTAMWRNICKELELKESAVYAVRSSATVEDSAAHSFAGQFDSYLGVSYKDLPVAIGNVLRSTFSPSVVSYFAAMNKPFGTKMGIVVQELVQAKKAGVIFGKDVQTHNEDVIVIDAAMGLAEGVVDGTAATERLYFSRSKHQLLKTSNKQSELTILESQELEALVDMTLSIEHLMEGTQDIEWAIDQQGRLWVIQSRAL